MTKNAAPSPAAALIAGALIAGALIAGTSAVSAQTVCSDGSRIFTPHPHEACASHDGAHRARRHQNWSAGPSVWGQDTYYPRYFGTRFNGQIGTFYNF